MKKGLISFLFIAFLTSLSFAQSDRIKEDFISYGAGKEILRSADYTKIVLGKPDEENIVSDDDSALITELWYKDRLYMRYHSSIERNHAEVVIAKYSGRYDRFELGITKKNELTSILGKPDYTESLNSVGAEVKLLYSNRIKNKTCSFFFKKDVLQYIVWNFWD